MWKGQNGCEQTEVLLYPRVKMSVYGADGPPWVAVGKCRQRIGARARAWPARAQNRFSEFQTRFGRQSIPPTLCKRGRNSREGPLTIRPACWSVCLSACLGWISFLGCLPWHSTPSTCVLHIVRSRSRFLHIVSLHADAM